MKSLLRQLDAKILFEGEVSATVKHKGEYYQLYKHPNGYEICFDKFEVYFKTIEEVLDFFGME